MKLRVTLTWRRLLLLPVLGLAAALAVGGSGLVSIAASSGHFAAVEWFLHWTFNRAVATQSLPISVPEGVDLADPTLVQRAAGHFASGCAPCHGAPGELQSPLTAIMVPPPPRLEPRIADWRDRELFWLGLHGIKYSGMPAWASQYRPDEVWAMVAFLRALPEMDAAAYGVLALGEAGDDMQPATAGEAAAASSGSVQTAAPAAPRPAQAAVGDADRRLALAGLGEARDPALADCARCHGLDGRGVGAAGAFPPIGGQPEPYLYETLLAYAQGRRESGIMTPAAGIHDEATLRRLAAHYAAQPPAAAGENAAGEGAAIPPPRGVALGEEYAARRVRLSVAPDAPGAEPAPAGDDAAVDPAAANGPPRSAAGLRELGRRIAEEGLPERKLAACDSCHGAAAAGTRNPLYPRLAGLPEWFTATNLQLWKDEHRGGTPLAHVMQPIAINMTTEQIDAVALWYASAPPGR